MIQDIYACYEIAKSIKDGDETLVSNEAQRIADLEQRVKTKISDDSRRYTEGDLTTRFDLLLAELEEEEARSATADKRIAELEDESEDLQRRLDDAEDQAGYLADLDKAASQLWDVMDVRGDERLTASDTIEYAVEHLRDVAAQRKRIAELETQVEAYESGLHAQKARDKRLIEARHQVVQLDRLVSKYIAILDDLGTQND